nr:hypothetical protein [Chlamydiota bacterium]
SLLNPSGYGIFLVEPNALAQTKWKEFDKHLAHEGAYVHAAIRAPEKLLAPEVSITPILIVLARTPSRDIFIAELLEEGQKVRVEKETVATS